jgi:hypothetical protein
MKYTALILILATVTASAQVNSTKFKNEVLKSKYLEKEDVKNKILPFDIAGLLTKTNDPSIFGFIGADFQRIKIKLISIIKNNDQEGQYFVYGKSMVKDNVCDFQGTINLTEAHYLTEPETKEFKEGIILGEYSFFENPSQKHVGQFKGIFKTGFYINKEGSIQYDDLAGDADGFSNNEFVGTWTSYNGKLIKDCNWGDHRIPMSGDLDIGSGEFIPNEKYINNGWQNYKLAYFGPPNKTSEDARKKENESWWK